MVAARRMRLAALLLPAAVAVPAMVAMRAPRPDTLSAGAPQAPRRHGPRIVYPAGHLPLVSVPHRSARPIKSILDIPGSMQFGEFVWNDEGVASGPVWVRVDLSRQMLSVFRSGHEIGTAVILYGTDGKPTPSGTFPILAKARSHRSSLYEAEMPYMLRLTGDGVAIHASNVRRGFATHGCIGIPPAFAEKLYHAVRTGDEVAILPAGIS